ncbi:MAG: TraB/GumN family protein [Paracoccaceae bacterium]|nr:TraB/GumN family protein [Paracoccaceae bacterium]
MHRLLATLAALLLLTSPLRAACQGENLLAAVSAETRTTLDAALARQPYTRGNFWRATRGNQVLHLIGTYHFDDPRHKATLASLAPLIRDAATVLVEAGPEEETALKSAIGRNPDLMLLTSGPSLLEQLEKPEWDMLAAAMRARGIPSVMAAKFKPWYVTMLLAIPACAMDQITADNGLDKQVIAAANAAGTPIRALEPYDTVLKLFDQFSPEDQLGMIRTTLPLESRAADYAATLADAYFDQDSRAMWEFMRLEAQNTPGYTPDQADAEYARMEEILMSRRNRAWIAVLEQAATEGPVLAAFGALHLSGRDGVLALLERAGFTLERLPL